MKRGIRNIIILISISFMIWIFLNCEYDAPTSMWNLTQSTAGNPQITSIDPPDSCVGGDIEIRILGENFSDSLNENSVYFDQTLARIKNVSNTEIVLFRPPLTGDSLRIKVVVQKAIEVIKLNQLYKITRVSRSFGNFLTDDNLQAIELDSDENLYGAFFDKSVVKISPDEEETVFGTLAFRPYDLRIGPDGYLYCAASRKVVFRIPPEGGESEEFPGTDLPENIRFIDFDENGNLYAGGNEVALYVIKPDGSYSSSNAYNHIGITTVRFYDGYIWVGGQYQEGSIDKWGVWRGQAGGGNVGNPELVLNSDQVKTYAGAGLLSLTFSNDGDMFIGTDQEEPILLKKANGEIQPLYYDILEPVADQLVWGNGNFLYMYNSETKQVSRIDMGKQGAPYYGRQSN